MCSRQFFGYANSLCPKCPKNSGSVPGSKLHTAITAHEADHSRAEHSAVGALVTARENARARALTPFRPLQRTLSLARAVPACAAKRATFSPRGKRSVTASLPGQTEGRRGLSLKKKGSSVNGRAASKARPGQGSESHRAQDRASVSRNSFRYTAAARTGERLPFSPPAARRTRAVVASLRPRTRVPFTKAPPRPPRRLWPLRRAWRSARGTSSTRGGR